MARKPLSIHVKPCPFSELPARKQAFVKHYVQQGDALAALKKAGYKQTGNMLHKASSLLRELTPYVSEQTTTFLQSASLAILGNKVVMELANDVEQPGAVRLNAAKTLMERAAPVLKQAEVVEHNHTHTDLTDEAIDKRLQKLQEQYFKQAPKLVVISDGR